MKATDKAARIASLYKRRYGMNCKPLTDLELMDLLENARETEVSLSARGEFWGMATYIMRQEIDSLSWMARARGLEP